MKKIIFFLLLGELLIHTAKAQYIQSPTAYAYKAVEGRNALQGPVGCGQPADSVRAFYAPDSTRTAYYLDTCNDVWYYFNSASDDQEWHTITPGSGGIGAIYAGDCLTKINDSTLALDLSCVMDTAFALNDSTIRFVKGDGTFWDIRNGSSLITYEGDTITINNIKIKNRFRVPLTDTTNAIKGCANIIYDTILEHFFGDVCVNGVHQAWRCFDCGYNTVNQIDDSTYVICRLDNTCDTIQFTQGATNTLLLQTDGVDNGSQSLLNLVAGTNINLTDNGSGSVTIDASGGGSGTVTSVGLAAPSIFTVTGSPVTTSGTLTFAGNGAQGDLIYGSAANTLAYLNKSTTTGFVLTNSGTNNNPAWGAPFTLTTTGTSGASTYTGGTLNIPQYTGGAPGGNEYDVQWKNGSNFGGVDSFLYNPTSRHLYIYNSRTTFSANSDSNYNALSLINLNPANGSFTTQNSPSILFGAQAWKSNATAGSWSAWWNIRATAITGGSSISGDLEFQSTYGNGVAPTNATTRAYIDGSGNVHAVTNLYTASAAGNGTVFTGTVDASTTSGTPLVFNVSNSSTSTISGKFASNEVFKFYQPTKNVNFQNGGTMAADAADGGQFNIYQFSGMTGLGNCTGTGGTTALTLNSGSALLQLQPGDQISIAAPNAETVTISSITSATAVVLTGNLANSHTNAAYTIIPATTRKFVVYNNGTTLQNGKATYPATNTAAGTTGNQTIHKPTGTVNIAAGGTTVTVTNSLCRATSIVFAVIRTNDATAQIKSVVPADGSFVINIVGSTGEVSIGWMVVN